MFRYQEKEYLPFSNQKYSIDCFGVVRENDKRLSVVKDKHGEKSVFLDWFDGNRSYRLVEIIAISYFKVKLPFELLEKIALVFKDGNKENLEISNLYYYFVNGPIESVEFPSYYYVPYYTDYLVNKNGEVISLKLYKRRKCIAYKKWTVTKPILNKNIKGGYFCGRGRRDIDDVDGVSRHRFIALAFIPYPRDPLELVVNHKNGIPGDDRITNLEWVTYSENTLHAYKNNLHPNKTVKIVFLNEKTGEEKKYSTITECCSENGFKFNFVSSRLRRQNVKYSDGIRFKLDDGTDWETDLILRSDSFPKTILAKDVYKNTVTIYKNAVEASKATEVNRVTIMYHCKNRPFTPIKGFNFRYIKEADNWPKYSEYHLRMFSRYPEGFVPNGVFLLDSENCIVRLFEDPKDLSKEFKIPITSLTKMIRRGDSIGNFKLKAFDVYADL